MQLKFLQQMINWYTSIYKIEIGKYKHDMQNRFINECRAHFKPTKACSIAVQIRLICVPTCLTPLQLCFVHVQTCLIPVQTCLICVQTCLIPVQKCLIPVQTCLIPVQPCLIHVKPCLLPIQTCLIPIQVEVYTHTCTDLSHCTHTCTKLSHTRTDMSHTCTDMSHTCTKMSHTRTDMSHTYTSTSIYSYLYRLAKANELSNSSPCRPASSFDWSFRWDFQFLHKHWRQLLDPVIHPWPTHRSNCSSNLCL